jgi:NADH:ubiquinone oxidoreductase subunit E
MFASMGTPHYVIRICSSPSCHQKGAEDFIELVERELGVKSGETSPGNRYELQVVDCIGMCDHRPSLMVNDTHYGDLTADMARSLIRAIKNR